MHSLWHNRDYRILLSGQVVSDFGSWVSQLAYPLLLLNLTGSPLQAGLSLALTNLPTFLFGIPAGLLIDSFNRKSLMIICDLLRFLILGSIPLAISFGTLSVAQVYLAAFLSGICDVIFSVAEQTAILRVVEKEKITQAFGQYEASTNSASLLGPAIGGFLYQVAPGLPFIVDALSYLISALSFTFIRTEFQSNTNKGLSLKNTAQGVVWLWNNTIIRSLALVRAIGGIVSGGQTLLLILMAQRFGANPGLIGLVFALSSIGVVLGSMLSNQLQSRLGLKTVLIGARWLIALGLVLQLISPNLVSLTLAAALSYFSVAVYGTIATSYRLKLVPDELQGRVNSFHRLLVFGGLAVGGALTGFLVEQIDLVPTFLIYSLLLAALALFMGKRLARPNFL